MPAYRPSPDRLVTFIKAVDETIAPARIHVEVDQPTMDVLRAIERTPSTVHVADRRRGKGAAITAGFELLDTEILAFADADGSTSPPALDTVIEPVTTGEVALAVGSRRHPESIVTVHQSRVRRRLGDGFVHLARWLLPIALYDYQCGAKAIDARLWREIRKEIRAPGFAWDIEFLVAAHAAGASIREIPISWEDRPGSTVQTVHTAVAFVRSLVRVLGWDDNRPVFGYLDRAIPQSPPLVCQSKIHGRSSTFGSGTR